VLLVICLVGFFNTFANDFVWDDPYLISDNQYIRDYRNIPLFFTSHYWRNLHPLQSFQEQYRPLRTTTFAIDYYLWKLKPAGYHISNLFFHMVNVVLIFFLVSAIGSMSENNGHENSVRCQMLMGLPFLTAALFAVHPVHTESVTYIKNRSDLLAFLFFLSSFLLFVRSGTFASGMLRFLSVICSLLCFVLALLSKEMALTLPAIMVLYALCFQERTERFRIFFRVVPYLLVILLYFWFRQMMLGNSGQAGNEFQLSTGRHLLTIIQTYGTYLALLVLPVNLNAERAFIIPESVMEPGVMLSLGVLLVISIVTVRAWRRPGILFFAIMFMLLALLPASNIIFLETRPIAEQRLYFPSLGFCLLSAWCIHYLYCRGINGARSKVTRAVAWSLAGLVISGYGLLTIQRNRDWRDPMTFYARTLESNPGSPRIHNNLGAELAAAGRHQEATAHFQNALRLYPAYTRAHNNLGVELGKTGCTDEAIKHYEQALKIDPEYVPAHYNLATTMLEKGQPETAIIHYNAVIQLSPNHVEAMNNLGLAYYFSDRQEEAMNCYLAALRIQPGYESAMNNLGAALIKTENMEETICRLSAGPLLDDQLVNLYNSIASIYLRQGRAGQARAFYEQALRHDPARTDVMYGLGLALITAESYPEAVSVFSKLLGITPNDEKARELYTFCLKMVAAKSIQ